MTDTDARLIERVMKDLRLAAAVCELDENKIVVRQAARIRGAIAQLRAALGDSK